MSVSSSQSKQGLIYGFTAYFIWGLAPVFFKLLQEVPTYEIIAHRIIWSLVLLVIIISASRNWQSVMAIFARPKTVMGLLLTSILVCSNWTIFIWAINHGHVLESSLGYFICPLTSIILAVLFLKERFRSLQWLALLLAGAGVMIQLWVFGSLPTIALGLAITFSFYGFFRKKIGVDAMAGLFFETLILLPFALAYLYFFSEASPSSNVLNNSMKLNLLLITCGAITTIPLLFFNAAAIRIKLSVLGLLQYCGPIMTFLLAVFVYHEPMGMDKWITFGFIWTGVALFVWDGVQNNRHQHH